MKIPQLFLTQEGDTCIVTVSGLIALGDLLWKFHQEAHPDFQSFGFAVTAILGAIAWYKQKDKENVPKNDN